MENPLKANEILHSGEGRDVERWLESRNNSFVFAIACVLLSIVFYFSYLCGCSSYLLSLLAFHPSLSLSFYTHLNKETIEHLNSYSRGIKRRSSRALHGKFSFNFCFD